MKIRILCILWSSFLFGQYNDKVGINTTTPEKELHVNGSAKTDQLYINDIETVGPGEDYRFLIKAPNNRITAFNEGGFADLTPSPLNRIKFVINFHADNRDHDWINQFNTRINFDKYLCIIASYSYNLPVFSTFSSIITPIPQIYITKHTTQNTWALKADYESFAPLLNQYSAQSGQWILEVLIIDRKYAKEFNHTVNMGGLATGSAATALVSSY